jgi:hypothetical protein
VFEILPSELTFEDKLKSISENLNFKKSNSLQFSLFLKREYQVTMSKDKREDESPMQYEIKNYKKERIAVFNFFLVSNKGELSVRTNNLKGISGKKYLLELNKLNKKIGVDWRVLVLRVIKHYFEQRNIKVIHEMPRRFASTPPEYLRYSKYYFNSAINAEIPLENIDFRYIPDKNLKNLFIVQKNIIQDAKNKIKKANLKKGRTKRTELKKLSSYLKHRF